VLKFLWNKWEWRVFSQGSYSSSFPADGVGAMEIRTSVVNNDQKRFDTMIVAAWSHGRVADSF